MVFPAFSRLIFRTGWQNRARHPKPNSLFSLTNTVFTLNLDLSSHHHWLRPNRLLSISLFLFFDDFFSFFWWVFSFPSFPFDLDPSNLPTFAQVPIGNFQTEILCKNEPKSQRMEKWRNPDCKCCLLDRHLKRPMVVGGGDGYWWLKGTAVWWWLGSGVWVVLVDGGGRWRGWYWFFIKKKKKRVVLVERRMAGNSESGEEIWKIFNE